MAIKCTLSKFVGYVHHGESFVVNDSECLTKWPWTFLCGIFAENEIEPSFLMAIFQGFPVDTICIWPQMRSWSSFNCIYIAQFY